MNPNSPWRMRMPRLASAIAIAALLLSGCAQYAAVKVEPRKIGGVYTVDPQIAWDSMKDGKTELWTVDGPLLDAVRFVTGIRDGESLFDRPGMELPVYRPRMTEPEIAELLASSLAAFGYANAATSNLRPAPFGSLPGFRFDLSFTDSDGLDWRGLVVGARDGDRLHLIIYTGAAIHYYDRYVDTVERLVASIRT